MIGGRGGAAGTTGLARGLGVPVTVRERAGCVPPDQSAEVGPSCAPCDAGVGITGRHPSYVDRPHKSADTMIATCNAAAGVAGLDGAGDSQSYQATDPSCSYDTGGGVAGGDCGLVMLEPQLSPTSPPT